MNENAGEGVRCTDVFRQLRELLKKSTPPQWAQYDVSPWLIVNKNNNAIAEFFWMEDESGESSNNAALTAATINALPALLEIAESAKSLIRGGYLDDEINAKNPLVLNLVDVVGDDRLPNREVSAPGASPGPVQPVVRQRKMETPHDF